MSIKIGNKAGLTGRKAGKDFMTQTEFNIECSKRLINPAVALENEKIVAALFDRLDELVLTLLDSEF